MLGASDALYADHHSLDHVIQMLDLLVLANFPCSKQRFDKVMDFVCKVKSALFPEGSDAIGTYFEE